MIFHQSVFDKWPIEDWNLLKLKKDKTNAGVVEEEQQPLFQTESGGAIPTSPLQLILKEVSKHTASCAYSRWHYLKDTEFISTINFVIYFQEILLGAISYGAPNAKKMKNLYNEKTQKGWWEIKRLALSEKCPNNSESRIIGISIMLLKKYFFVKGIITLADSSMGHQGIIYKATGFTYYGLTAPKSDYIVDGKKIQRGRVKGLQGHWVIRSQKHLFVKLFPNLNPSQSRA